MKGGDGLTLVGLLFLVLAALASAATPHTGFVVTFEWVAVTTGAVLMFAGLASRVFRHK